MVDTTTGLDNCNDVDNEKFNNNNDDCNSDATININRQVINQKDLYSKYKNVDLESPDFKIPSDCFGLPNAVQKFKWTPLHWFVSLVPFFEWFPQYQWKEDLKNDIVAGITVAVMHIPAGMGVALLSHVDPVIGIYMSFFPVILYTFLGTSRHGSIGAFAVMGLMTGSIVTNQLNKNKVLDPNNPTFVVEGESSSETSIRNAYSAEQIVAAISLTVGLCQIIMGFFRLGKISLLLSPALVNGFTTGAAIHLLTSQVKNLFGLKIKEREGFFKIPLTYYDVGSHIQDSNITAIIMSTVATFSLVVYNELLKERIGKRIPFPIPIEMIVILIGTLVSYFGNFQLNYGISIIGDIPTGMPTPTLPPLDIIPDIVVGSLIISVVAYAVSISMAKLFADKHHYEVDANQELLAMGSSNIFGSFFKCPPVSISLARSLVQESVGGRTQLTAIFSCGILLVVLLWIGPYFQALPHCILSTIIVVALKRMLQQVFEMRKIWKECSLHGLIWTAAFFGAVILDIEYGLGIGLLLSLVTLIWRSNKAEMYVLGQYENYDLYVDLLTCNDAREIPQTKIIKYSGNLNFATIDYFLNYLNYIVKTEISEKQLKWVVLDLSSASSIDPGALKLLKNLHKVNQKKGIHLFYTNCSVNVFHAMLKCGFVNFAGTNSFFPTIHDAITFCRFHDKVS